MANDVTIDVVPDPVTAPVSDMDWLAVKNDDVAVDQSLICVCGIEIVALPAAVSRPFASQVSVGTAVAPPALPAVSRVARVSVPVALADPSKEVDHVPSPVIEIVRAVESLVAVAALPVVEALPMYVRSVVAVSPTIPRTRPVSSGAHPARFAESASPVRFPDIPPFAVIRPEAVRVPVTLTPVDVAVSMPELLTPK